MTETGAARSFTSARMVAPRAAAASASSRTSTAAPSPITNLRGRDGLTRGREVGQHEKFCDAHAQSMHTRQSKKTDQKVRQHRGGGSEAVEWRQHSEQPPHPSRARSNGLLAAVGSSLKPVESARRRQNPATARRPTWAACQRSLGHTDTACRRCHNLEAQGRPLRGGVAGLAFALRARSAAAPDTCSIIECDWW